MTRLQVRSAALLGLAGLAVVAALTACDRDTSPSHSIATEIQPMAWPDSMIAGQAVTFQATVLDQHGDTIVAPNLSWNNDAPSVLSIQTLANGDSIRVTAVRPGSATVSVDVVGADDSVQATGTVRVVLAGARITQPDGAANLATIGSHVVVAARALGFDESLVDSTGLAWTHGGDSIVAISTFAGGDSVTVTAAHYGVDTVTATAPSCHGACSASLVVMVGHGVASVNVTPAADTLTTLGATVQLAAAARDAHESSLTGVSFMWASSDSSIVTVDSTGLVTAVAAGTANIFAFGEGVESNGAAVVVAPLGGPSAGGDVVVFNDINMFEDEELEGNANNVKLVQNLVSYTASGARASGKRIWMDFGHGALCDECIADDSLVATISALGDTLEAVHIAQGDLTSIPSDVKVIMLFTPTQTYTVEEVNALKAFAQHGGRVVYVGEWSGYYGTYFPVENQFLSNMGAQMTNNGGLFACGELPGSSLRATQITSGLTSLTMGCASEVIPGPEDFIFAYFSDDSGGQHAVAGVAHIDTSPVILPAGQLKHPFHTLVAPSIAPVVWKHPGMPNR